MRVMVTGSRKWRDREAIRTALADIHAVQVTLIHGDAPGADQIAASEASLTYGWDVVPYAADWERLGQAAGPVRNQEMVDTKPDVVFAFPGPGSVGTWDAVRRAQRAGIRVEVFGEHR